MPAWLKDWLPLVTLLIGVGAHKLFSHAAGLLERERLAKTFKDAKEYDRERGEDKAELGRALGDLKRDLTGARRAIRDELNGIGKRVDAATAAAHLAVQNADHALQQIEEIRSIFELQFEHIDEKVPPLQRQLEVWTDIARSIAVNTHAILSDLQNMRGEIDRIKNRLP